MAYCTEADMVAEFGETELLQLTDDDGSGEIGTELLAKAISRADIAINRYLAGQTALPVANGLLTDVACDIARYFLYKHDVPDLVKQRYEAAIKYLEQVAQGKINLSGTGDTPETPRVEAGAAMSSGGSVFSRDRFEY